MVTTPEDNERQQTPPWVAALGYAIQKSLFCDSGSTLERLVIAGLMATTGACLLAGLYLGHWMSPGFARGFVAWLIGTVFFAKAANLNDCGGPIASACPAAIVAYFLESCSSS